MTVEVRRALTLAVLGLLLGLGLVAGLFRGADHLKRASAPATPSEAGPGSVGARSPGADASRSDPGRPANAAPPAPGAQPGAPSRDGAAASAAPTFDIVRVEPNGESVVAGRGAPNTVVEMLVDGTAVARALSDPNGQFALVPPALNPGNSEIVLRQTTADGRETRSKESVAVAIAPGRGAKPLVALTSPDKPTVVLSQPEAVPPAAQATAGKGVAEAPGTGPGRQAAPGGAASGKETAEKGTRGKASAAVKIVSVDAQEGGRLYVTGKAPPGATLRLYLNDTLIAPASVGADGTVTFTIGRGVKPGTYSVRVDQVDSVSGKVRGRAEVPFTVPEPAPRVAGDPAAGKPAPRIAARAPGGPPAPEAKSPIPAPDPRRAPDGGAAQAPAVVPATPTDAMAAAPPAGPGAVFVPEISTARIVRGDSLWQISRRTYGKGDRYTVIYDANQEQIRNPDLIYPGQIFVLPGEDAPKGAPKGGGRG